MQIFSLFGEILLKDSGVESKLDNYDKKGSKLGGTFDNAFSKIGSAALKLGGILGVGLGFKSIIDSASASQKRLAQMDAVLNSTGGAAGITKDELLKLADAQSKLTTFSKGANIESENLLLTFTGIGKKVFPDALKTVNDMSQALGQDTKSSCIQLGKALNDPINGMTALKRVGVTFNETQVETIKKLQEAGDVEGAQKVMLQELQKEFGGSAEAAGKTFAGQMTILKNQITGVGGSLGGVLLPHMTDFITKINTHMPKIKQVITDAIGIIMPKFKEWVGIISSIVSELLPSFGKSTDDAKIKVFDLAKNGLNFVTDALRWIKDNIGLVKAGVIALTAVWVIQHGIIIAHNIALAVHNAAQLVKNVQDKIETAQIIALYVAQGIHNGVIAAATAAQWLFNAALSANPIGIVIIAITALIAGLVLLFTHNEKVRTALIGVWSAIKDFFVGLWNWTKEFFSKWGVEILAVLVPFIGIPLLIMKHWGEIKTFVVDTFNSIIDFFKKLPSKFLSLTEDIGKAIINGLNTAITFITSLPQKALQWGKDFIQGLINGIKNMIGEVVNAVSNVADKVKSFLHFSRPDTGPLADYETWMPDFMTGLASGIEKNKGLVTNAVKNMAGDMKVNLNTGINASGTSISTASAIDYKKLAAAISEGMYDLFDTLPQQAVDLSIDGTKLGRVMLPKIITEKQRLGLDTL